MKTKKQVNWTYEKDMKLIELYRDGRSNKFLSEYFGASSAAISTRVSDFRKFGFIKEKVQTRSPFDRETFAEMKDSVTRFDTIADIPNEWKTDWAQRNGKNLLQVGKELSKLYENIRGGK